MAGGIASVAMTFTMSTMKTSGAFYKDQSRCNAGGCNQDSIKRPAFAQRVVHAMGPTRYLSEGISRRQGNGERRY
jgi:hypothetical protein